MRGLYGYLWVQHVNLRKAQIDIICSVFACCYCCDAEKTGRRTQEQFADKANTVGYTCRWLHMHHQSWMKTDRRRHKEAASCRKYPMRPSIRGAGSNGYEEGGFNCGDLLCGTEETAESQAGQSEYVLVKIGVALDVPIEKIVEFRRVWYLSTLVADAGKPPYPVGEGHETELKTGFGDGWDRWKGESHLQVEKRIVQK